MAAFYVRATKEENKEWSCILKTDTYPDTYLYACDNIYTYLPKFLHKSLLVATGQSKQKGRWFFRLLK